MFSRLAKSLSVLTGTANMCCHNRLPLREKVPNLAKCKNQFKYCASKMFSSLTKSLFVQTGTANRCAATIVIPKQRNCQTKSYSFHLQKAAKIILNRGLSGKLNLDHNDQDILTRTSDVWIEFNKSAVSGQVLFLYSCSKHT